MKAILEAGPGGHLVEMSRIWPALSKHELVLITSTVAKETTSGMGERFPFRVFFAPHRFTRLSGNLFADYVASVLVDMIGNARFLARLFRTERPDVLISTGAATTILSAFIAKVAGARVIFVESAARIWSSSPNGRIVYWMADLFLVQWESVLPRYGKKAQYWGGML